MAMDKIGDGLKKVLLVGIGAAATTVEKSQQIIDDLVKKGEITVEQGKELNKELQHNVKKTIDARKADAGTIEEKLSKMTADELAFLKAKIKEAEDAIADVTGTAEGDEAAAASAELDQMDDDLKKEGYIDEKEHCRRCTEVCISKGYGPLRIRSELIKKGFTSRMIDYTMQNTDADFEEKLRMLMKKKKDKASDYGAIYRYFYTRGYSGGMIADVYHELFG